MMRNILFGFFSLLIVVVLGVVAFNSNQKETDLADFC